MKLTKEEIYTLTCGKHSGIPPRIGFGGLNTACTMHRAWYQISIALSSYTHVTRQNKNYSGMSKPLDCKIKKNIYSFTYFFRKLS